MNRREREELDRLREAWGVPDRPVHCEMCGYFGPHIQAHHAIGKATLKRLMLQKNRPAPASVQWDQRNRIWLCAEPAPNNCHGRHTTRFRPLPPSVLSSANWEFARELEMSHVLERDYPREPPARVTNLKPQLHRLFSGDDGEAA